jgi:hypothetical protein
MEHSKLHNLAVGAVIVAAFGFLFALTIPSATPPLATTIALVP